MSAECKLIRAHMFFCDSKLDKAGGQLDVIRTSTDIGPCLLMDPTIPLPDTSS